jgi:hypothetical protein
MPEVWMNYGPVDAVLDIRAENLGDTLGGDAEALSQEGLDAALAGVPVDDSTVLVVLHDTAAVRHTISRLYALCEGKSAAFPRILADGGARVSIGAGLPEGSVVGTFGAGTDDLGSNLIFVSEVEPDGLFGYQTVCTRLLRRFGRRQMLEAYECRAGDAPVSGSDPPPYSVAREFAEQFEVSSIEVAGGRKGVYGLYAGHPSACDAQDLAGPYASVGVHSARTAVGSSGRAFGPDTLARSLPSLWTLWGSLRSGGQAVLLAECGGGLGSEALLRHTEGSLGDLHHPSEYVGGMEDVLFTQTVTRDTDVVLVTALPEVYAGRLGMTLARQAQGALDVILKKNPRRKITILPDASRTVLRQEPGGEGGAENG